MTCICLPTSQLSLEHLLAGHTMLLPNGTGIAVLQRVQLPAPSFLGWAEQPCTWQYPRVLSCCQLLHLDQLNSAALCCVKLNTGAL